MLRVVGECACTPRPWAFCKEERKETENVCQGIFSFR